MLALDLARLRTHAPGLTAIGLSATVARPSELAAFLVPHACQVATRLAEIVAQGRLDEPAHLQPDGLRPSIRRFVCDLVEEYGRHTGHADLLREAIDGRVGEDPPGDWAWPALRPAL